MHQEGGFASGVPEGLNQKNLGRETISILLPPSAQSFFNGFLLSSPLAGIPGLALSAEFLSSKDKERSKTIPCLDGCGWNHLQLARCVYLRCSPRTGHLPVCMCVCVCAHVHAWGVFVCANSPTRNSFLPWPAQCPCPIFHSSPTSGSISSPKA